MSNVSGSIVSSDKPIRNIESLEKSADFSGFFNAWPDPDGVYRRTSLMMKVGERLYPSFALQIASLYKNANVTSDRLSFGEINIPVNQRGDLKINFGGPAFSFPYVSVLDLFDEGQSENLKMLMKDKIVLVGLTALGLQDVRSFPHDPQTPGVEGHAWIIDNLLTQKFLKGEGFWGAVGIFLFLFIGGLFLARALSHVKASIALAVPFLLSVIIFAVDQWLFANNSGWNLLYAEVLPVILGLTSFGIRFRQEEKSKKHVRNAFGHYLSRSVVDWVLSHPDALKLGGERKEVTVMFTDIRGFTTFSETQDPARLSSFLNQYMELMTDLVVEKHAGTLDKYIGDAIMAFWGAPIPSEKHSQSALDCAVNMIRTLSAHQQNFIKDFGFKVEIGIGLHTGTVTVGNMGSKKNFNYTVIGDSVNLASRIEGLCKFYGAQILVSDKTFLTAGGEGRFVSRCVDKVKVAGKSEVVKIYQIYAESSPSKEFLDLFHHSQQLYWSKKIAEALEGFNRAQSIYSSDKTNQMYIDRCQELMSSKVPEDWDGTFSSKKG